MFTGRELASTRSGPLGRIASGAADGPGLRKVQACLASDGRVNEPS
jgi:hypothetical protein